MLSLQSLYQLTLLVCLAFQLTTCLEEIFLYDTSGSKDYGKAGARVSLTSPLRFYDEDFSTVYAHINGYVTFADEKIWIPSYFSESQVMAPCMVEIQDNNNLGSIRILATKEEYQLNRATADVISHFTLEEDFRAKQVVIITWNGLLSQETTIQNVIIIGEESTFALFLFRNRNGHAFEDSIRILDVQSGFSSGDKVRITELLGFRLNRHVEYLFKQSNVMMPGKWVFKIGSRTKDFFQVQMPDAYSVYNQSIGQIVREDIDECKERISECHRYAYCTNMQHGYNCTCSTSYYGNGRICLRQYSVVNIEGKVTGKLNDFDIGVAELAAHISDRNGDIFASIGPVAPRFGHLLQMIPALSGIIGWLFGMSSSGKSGIHIVGNRFKSTTLISFETGEVLYIKQEMNGYDAFGSLVLATRITGNVPIPLTQVGSVRSMNSYTERYVIGDIMSLYGEGAATYLLDGRPIQYKINRKINYQPVNKNMDYKVLVKVTNTVTSFFDVSGNSVVRFRQKYSISEMATSPTTATSSVATNPAERTTKRVPTAKTNEKVTETRTREITLGPKEKKTEATTMPTTTSVKKPEKIVKTTRRKTTVRKTEPKTVPATTGRTTPRTREVPSTESSTKPLAPTTASATTKQMEEQTPSSTPANPCRFEKCAENAVCKIVKTRSKCVCKSGFVGNGTICTVDRRKRCGSYLCHENSECIRSESQYFCKCKDGYVGDGVRCHVDVPCNCHMNAECYSNREGAKYCVCKLGFKGDGKHCADIDECRDKKINCLSNSKCVNSIGSYQCVCNEGFRKNGTQCLDIPECLEQKSACGDHAICMEVPGSFKCSCPKGFHFGYRERNCFPDCPRCLNGGTCVGKFGCKCAAGYSGEICQWVGDEFLLYAQGGNIKRFSYPYSPMSYGYIYRNPTHLMVGVDYDCKNKKVYWTDITSGSIQRSNHDGSEMETVVKKLSDPQGLTVDWLGRNMFWTDNGFHEIQVSSLDGKHRKVLFKGGITNPRPIVCNPYTGQLFWGDWDRKRPRIEVASMDGTNRKVLVSRDLGLPNGLTIDYKARDLCWTDAALQQLSCIGLDGRNQRQLGNKIGYPFGITMHNSMLYWTNWVTDNIGRFDKENNQQMAEVNSGFGRDGKLLDIKSVSACPERKNVCSFQNGGCRKLCLAKLDGGRTCT